MELFDKLSAKYRAIYGDVPITLSMMTYPDIRLIQEAFARR